jgi:hypothetical protein
MAVFVVEYHQLHRGIAAKIKIEQLYTWWYNITLNNVRITYSISFGFHTVLYAMFSTF